ARRCRDGTDRDRRVDAHPGRSGCRAVAEDRAQAGDDRCDPGVEAGAEGKAVSACGDMSDIKLEKWLVIGHLMLVELAPRCPNKTDRWVCRCVCGEIVVRTVRRLESSIRLGVKPHCGCHGASDRQKTSKRCACEGLPHRRPLQGCPPPPHGCGLPYAPDVLDRPNVAPGCGLARLY